MHKSLNCTLLFLGSAGPVVPDKAPLVHWHSGISSLCRTDLCVNLFPQTLDEMDVPARIQNMFWTLREGKVDISKCCGELVVAEVGPELDLVYDSLQTGKREGERWLSY